MSDPATNPPTLGILIVEDHGDTSRVLRRLVLARGFHVVTSGSLAHARLRLQAGDIGFIISDLGLPDGNACELMAEARDNAGLKGVAITGFGRDADVGRTREAGFLMHLTKPIESTELDAVLVVARQEIELRQQKGVQGTRSP